MPGHPGSEHRYPAHNDRHPGRDERRETYTMPSTSMASPHVAPQKQPWGAWQRDGQLIRYSPISTNPAMSLNWPSNKKMAAR
jgi:hypothetical protein